MLRHRIFFSLIVASIAAAPSLAARNLMVSDDVADPMTLDPQKEFSEKNHTICQQIFDGLIRFDPDGKIEPALAVSWERVNDLTIRFKLREGVFFHNGEPLDSGAVKFSIERYLDPKTGFPARAFIESIAGVATPDRYTVDIITKYPDGLLLNRLAGFILIVPPQYIKEKGEDYFAANPMGTGAFIFRSWEKGSQIVLAANRKYWLSGYPKVDGLIFKFIPQEKQIAALLAGKVDLITDLPGSQTLRVMKHPGTTVIKKASFYTVLASMNLSTGPLRALDVRQALNYAIDKNALVRYDLLGNGWPIASLSMSGEFGHNEDLLPYPLNLKKARMLLAQAGYANGITLNALVKRNTIRTAKILKSQLALIGVNLKITEVTDAAMTQEFAKKTFDIAIGDNPDPMYHSYFNQAIVLYSKSPYCLGGDPAFDSMLEKTVSTLDATEREKLAFQLDSYIYNKALSLFTYQKVRISGIRQGLHFIPYASGMPYFFSTYFS
jgi:peptide/nickel transport system substrate-binding protein